MPHYLSIHRSPGLSEEEIAGYTPETKKCVHAESRQLYVNLDEGYIVSIYEAPDAERVQAEFDRIGWPVDTMTEVQFQMDRAMLDSIPS